jgi:hypothetical protein
MVALQQMERHALRGLGPDAGQDSAAPRSTLRDWQGFSSSNDE